MPVSQDRMLLETVRTRRIRLQSALVYGERSRRRVALDNGKRLLGSCVVAALGCGGGVAYA